ncbi:hypothetical protein S7711_04709 [Stachybotrys chartarum IBT 7711]|uniref:Major facilitator superfamily (MFS) profile domain-containing protein n=1 Tax=Stachybotrys chartarum (strain CBS 109288 / IBT 7711) TaxID=1280523 RepID=A0A084ANZ8_STACB|nr:hypothetical protein S7711_04709 [Stachybotrys chartarum IBT 7711]
MGESCIDYSVVDHSQKWAILRDNWRFTLWAMYSAIGSMMLGWDYVSGSQLASLPEFRRQFGVEQSDGSYLIPSHVLSAWQAIGPAAHVIAAIVAAPLLEKWGRKPQIIPVVLLSLGGVILQQYAVEWTLHLAGRAINGASIGIMFTISPLWIGESCRPELRGFFLCFFNTSHFTYGFSVVIAYGASNIDGRWQWWTVIVSMYFLPGVRAALLTIFFPWFPESPYWLIRENKPDKARRALERIYGKAKQHLIDCEMRRLSEDVRFNAELQLSFEGPTYSVFGIAIGQELECFRGKNLKRSLTAMLASSGQQLIGASFATGYATYFFELIGIEQYFLASCIMYVVMLLSNGAAFPAIEVIGRRTLIVPALFMLTTILLAMGIAGCFSTQAALWAIVVLMYLWAIIYQVSLGACGFVLASEIATLRLRASTQALVTVMNGVWGLIMQFTIPYMINPDSGNLGGRTGFIFFGTGLLTAIAGYFMFPETKGITFEKMDKLYESGVSPRHFKKAAASIEESEAGEKTEVDERKPSTAEVEVSQV